MERVALASAQGFGKLNILLVLDGLSDVSARGTELRFN